MWLNRSGFFSSFLRWLLSLTILLAAAADAQTADAPTLVPEFKIQAVHAGPDAQVHEGAQAEFLVTKTTRMSVYSVTVDFETWEPNLEDSNGDNPSLQTHRITFFRNGITAKTIKLPEDNSHSFLAATTYHASPQPRTRPPWDPQPKMIHRQ